MCDLQGADLGGDLLQNLAATKFLRIHIDSNLLKFEVHVFKLCSEISSGCIAIRWVRVKLEEVIARISYFP